LTHFLLAFLEFSPQGLPVAEQLLLQLLERLGVATFRRFGDLALEQQFPLRDLGGAPDSRSAISAFCSAVSLTVGAALLSRSMASS